MPWLDPRVRCDHCGIPFAEGSDEVCPSCGAELAVVGTQSELREWGTTRRRGRARFVWRWVLGWGGLIAGIQCAVTALAGQVNPIVYAFTALWPIGGYIIGRLYWRGAEREYTAWTGQPGKQPHAEPLPLNCRSGNG